MDICLYRFANIEVGYVADLFVDEGRPAVFLALCARMVDPFSGQRD